ncbi:hypothetical protein JD844_027691 [Phrynosoma platyrhinos]|uniref:TBC1 domain family member 22A n=1 Tax=Phrynosoma platyrhinos TaxID=52577 RepID=A0ABQ7SGP0_PHRPL|nr:hypothetical protein JD844_027691 [Phrynosoma platyrhinos]
MVAPAWRKKGYEVMERWQATGVESSSGSITSSGYQAVFNMYMELSILLSTHCCMEPTMLIDVLTLKLVRITDPDKEKPMSIRHYLKPGTKAPTTPVKLKKVSTFQEFESNTSDAWDAGDDDDELLAMATENLNTDVVMETANRVIQNHSKLQEQHKLQEEQVERQQAQQLSDLPSACGDNRLVKSVSESNTSTPTDSANENAYMPRSQSLPQTSTVTMVGEVVDHNTSGLPILLEREASRLDKFKQLLAGPNTNLDLDFSVVNRTEELRKLSWSGIPKPVRPITWKLLSGYLPANVDRRQGTLQRKRKEYFAFVEQYYDSRNEETHQDTYRQVKELKSGIHIDIPRMSPEALILQPKVTEATCATVGAF